MTIGLARTIATDVGTRHARDHGRAVWSEEDFNAATAELARLCHAYGLHDPWRSAGFGAALGSDQ
jgi:hypothetical protein